MGCVRGHVGPEPRSVVLTMHYFRRLAVTIQVIPVLSAAHRLNQQTYQEKNCRRRRRRRRRRRIAGRLCHACGQADNVPFFEVPAEAPLTSLSLDSALGFFGIFGSCRPYDDCHCHWAVWSPLRVF